MKFERLKALHEANANVHYKGKLCEVISINQEIILTIGCFVNAEIH